MKQKELKNLAKKIAMAEQVIETSDNEEEIQQAKECIMKLTRKVTSIEDYGLLDELILSYMSKS